MPRQKDEVPKRFCGTVLRKVAAGQSKYVRLKKIGGACFHYGDEKIKGPAQQELKGLTTYPVYGKEKLLSRKKSDALILPLQNMRQLLQHVKIFRFVKGQRENLRGPLVPPH